MDFGDTATAGLSYVDDEKGCYIFVNCNSAMTLERMIFTVFHEYGHIILHRPIYKRKLVENNSTGRSFLDRMADCFAGYFLVPEEFLTPYRSMLNCIDYGTLLTLKQKFQVSLQAFVMSLRSYNYLSHEYVNSFFAFLDQKHLRTVEPSSISEQPQILQYFESIKNARALSMLQSGVTKKYANAEDIQAILWVSEEEAIQILEKMQDSFCHKDIQDWFFFSEQ